MWQDAFHLLCLGCIFQTCSELFFSRIKARKMCVSSPYSDFQRRLSDEQVGRNAEATPSFFGKLSESVPPEDNYRDDTNECCHRDLKHIDSRRKCFLGCPFSVGGIAQSCNGSQKQQCPWTG